MRIITIILFSFFFFINFNTVEAQSDWLQKANVEYANAANLDSKLTKKEKQFIDEIFGSKAKKIVYNNPDFLKSIKHLLRNRISIIKVGSNVKAKKGKLLSLVPFADDYVVQKKANFSSVKGFNPLKYKMAFFSKGTYMYVIDNTNYVIQITSQFRK